VPRNRLGGDQVGPQEGIDRMHDLLDRQVDEGRARHVRERHGVQCDVDSARLCRHGVGMLGHGALVERVDLRHVGCIANVVRHRLEPGPCPAGEVDVGAGTRKRTRDGAADRPAAAVDHCGLVLQHHLDLLR
jgi:hypothetical protein